MFCFHPVTFFFLLSSLSGNEQEKPRVIVLTDIENEPDDAQSLLRFLTDSGSPALTRYKRVTVRVGPKDLAAMPGVNETEVPNHYIQ